MTVLEVLNASTSFLTRKGIESPRLNAEHLLAPAMGCRRLDLYLRFDEGLDEGVMAKAREQVRLRGTGVPLQHLLGTVEIAGHTFLCDARALVPRPETELLIEKPVERIRAMPPPANLRIADIGTGSGIIAISLALAFPDAAVEAVDRSPEALALARENAGRLTASITFHEGYLLQPLSGEFHVICANLPYIPSGDLAGLSVEVRHDPAMALDGGPDGLDLIRELLAEIPARLAPGGLVVLEYGDGQEAAVAAAGGAVGLHNISVEQDYAGKPRFFFASR